MKKKIYIVFCILFIVFLLFTPYVYGFHKSGLNEQVIVTQRGTTRTDAKNKLKQHFGYDGEINTQMKITTKIRVEKQLTNYMVYIGNEIDEWTPKLVEGNLFGNVSKGYLEKNFGYKDEYGEEPWDVTLIVVNPYDKAIHSGDSIEFGFHIKEVYSGEDGLKEAEDVTVNSEIAPLALLDTQEKFGYDDTPGARIGKALEGLGELFEENPLGALCSLLLDFFRVIGDGIQIIINLFQTATLNRASEFRLAYTYDELVEDYNNGKKYQDSNVKEEEKKDLDASSGTRDAYTDVSRYGTGYEENWQKGPIIINGNDYRYTMETEIPVIPIDIYTMATGKVDMFDVNFLEGNDDSPIKVLKNFVAAVIHVVLYISAAVLLITLIWHGINIIKGSFGNPQAQVEHKEGLKRFAISLIMLVGSVVIIALGIYAGDMFIGDFKSNTDELPIRVYVNMAEEGSKEPVGYSFSTNITGFVRYKAQSGNINNCGEKAAYVFSYLALVLVNAVGALGMFFRMLMMLILAIVGPIIAALYALHMEDKISFKYTTWINLYVVLSCVQVILAIASRIILECAILD